MGDHVHVRFQADVGRHRFADAVAPRAFFEVVGGGMSDERNVFEGRSG
jgi:hypothetical protein